MRKWSTDVKTGKVTFLTNTEHLTKESMCHPFFGAFFYRQTLTLIFLQRPASKGGSYKKTSYYYHIRSPVVVSYILFSSFSRLWPHYTQTKVNNHGFTGKTNNEQVQTKIETFHKDTRNNRNFSTQNSIIPNPISPFFQMWLA